MSNTNPLIPQGSLLERKAKGKPHLRVAYIIVAVHLVFLGGLLIQGCKREDPETKTERIITNETGLAQLPSDSLYNTNPATPPSNSPIQDLAQTSAPLPTTPAAQNLTVPTPVETPANREYVVLKGDSFYSIGKKFNVSTRAIARANPSVDPNRLKVGEKLQIPPPAPSTPATLQASLDNGANLYVVKSGDTLSKIATTHGATVPEIKSLNGLKTDRINVGDKLKLPPPKSAPASTTTSAAATTPTSLPGATANP